MSIPLDFLASLVPADMREYVGYLRSGKRRGGQVWTIENEIRPVDLYCYLWSRFGRPNGVQNFLRSDDSDNLIHWDWTLSSEHRWVVFLGMSFRTEIHFIGPFPLEESDKANLVQEIKADFQNYSRQMSEVRINHLEKWVEFVNPYQRLKQSVECLLTKLEALALDPEKDAASSLPANQESVETWKSMAERYNQGLGLCFGVRAMLPVMAEAFVNLVLFMLLKPEIRADKRLLDYTFRQPIDIRIKTLNLTCLGFERAVDYSGQVCQEYHSFVNERNDLLHGNIVIDKLKFNDVFFNGRVPVFEEYHSMWQRSLGVMAWSVGLDAVHKEVQVVTELIEYVLSCVEEGVRKQLEAIMGKSSLGYRPQTQRVGILFSDYLVDWQIGEHG